MRKPIWARTARRHRQTGKFSRPLRRNCVGSRIWKPSHRDRQ
jgi:hypothetical protein